MQQAGRCKWSSTARKRIQRDQREKITADRKLLGQAWLKVKCPHETYRSETEPRNGKRLSQFGKTPFKHQGLSSRYSKGNYRLYAPRARRKIKPGTSAATRQRCLRVPGPAGPRAAAAEQPFSPRNAPFGPRSGAERSRAGCGRRVRPPSPGTAGALLPADTK